MERKTQQLLITFYGQTDSDLATSGKQKSVHGFRKNFGLSCLAVAAANSEK
jgi:hypothetical protein